MDRGTPGFPVLHHLQELAQVHVHWVSDAIQQTHPLLSPSSPVSSLSQHQGLSQWVSSSHQVTEIVELQVQHQSFWWIFRIDFLEDWLHCFFLIAPSLSLQLFGRLPCPGVPQGPAQFHHLCLDVLPQDVHPAPSLCLGLCLDISSQSHFPWPRFLEISVSFFIFLCSIQRILYSFLNNRSLNHVNMEGTCIRKDNYNFHVDFPRHGGSVSQPWIVQGLMVKGNKKETNKTYNDRCVCTYRNLYHRSLGRITHILLTVHESLVS